MITNAHLDAVLGVWSQQGEKTTSSLIGHSMSPLIKDGDTVVIEHGKNRIHTGDIVVFKDSHKICAHRMIGMRNKKKRPEFQLKGDNRATFDPLITAEQVIGKIIAVKGVNGHLKFDSFFWRPTNYTLSQLSNLSGKCYASDSNLWKTLDRFLSFFSGIILKEKTFWNTLRTGLAKAVRIKNGFQPVLHTETKE